MPPPEPPPPREACPNCGERWGAERPNYCPSCGQETNIKPPTVGEFIQQFGGSYIAAEGALWRTLKLLLLKPGALTREYLDGRRRRYVLPLRLYLTISVIVLLLLRSVAAVGGGSAETALERKAPRHVRIELGVGSAGLEEGVFFCRDLPAWLCRRLQRRYDTEPKLLVREIQQIGERVLANLGTTMFVLLPGFAFGLWLSYRNRRLQYTEHMVFALHVHAFWFVMLGLTLVDLGWLTVAAALAVPAYTLLAMRRVYGGRGWPLLLRAVLISAMYGITMGLALFVMSAVLVVF